MCVGRGSEQTPHLAGLVLRPHLHWGRRRRELRGGGGNGEGEKEKGERGGGVVDG